MSQRTKVVGARAPIIWLLIVTAVVAVAALAVGVLVIYPQLQEEQDAEQHYQAGVTFQNVEDWEAAEAEFKQVISIDANYKDVQTRLAEVKARLAESKATATAVAIAQAEQAQVDAQATAAAAPTATAEALEAHYQKGLGYINLERWEEAKAELEQVFEVDPNYKDVQAKLTEVKAELVKLIPTATPVPPTPEVVELKPDYDSGWVADNRSRNHRTVFTHGLGVVPSRVTILFSPTAPHKTVYPLLWSWTEELSGNPVTVELSTTQLVLNIWSGGPLHGVWSGDTEQWTEYDSGYWRVLLWR